MNPLLTLLSQKSPFLYSSFEQTYASVKLLLSKYDTNFSSYTDHSMYHTEAVLDIVGELLTETELSKLNEDELYILAMASILHDVGMCIPESKIEDLSRGEEYQIYLKEYQNRSLETYLRDVHHVLSYNFILAEREALKIPSEDYAEAIALVAQGHRKVDLLDSNLYNPNYFARGGRQSSCLPYLAAILRLADELDVTNMRTPDILLKYYFPDNEVSQREFAKHQATTKVNYNEESVIVTATCTDYKILSALEQQFEKIENVIQYCQKVIRSMRYANNRNLSLQISKLEPNYKFKDFKPQGIKYSFDVKNVVNAFVGKDLYGDHTAAIREGIQNAIDATNYRKSLQPGHKPEIIVEICEDELRISDNGLGMDSFIIEHYFGKLASSFYEQESVKSEFQAIGQFGIGVFSYFLISDYIEVETRTPNGESLRFRTDQDPNAYFHFYDNFIKKDEGTVLKLHFKKEFIGKMTFSRMEKFIKQNFPFIESDIILKDKDQVIKIAPNSYVIKVEDFYRKMLHQARGQEIRIEKVSVFLDENSCIGEMAIAVPSSLKDLVKFSEVFYAQHFDAKNHISYTDIRFAQKGVYVNNYGRALRFVLGNINLKLKLRINLNREGFNNEDELDSIFDLFEAKIIEEFFTNYANKVGAHKDKDKVKLSEWFYHNIFRGHWAKNSPISNAFNKHFKQFFRINGKLCVRSIEEVIALSPEILIIPDKVDIPEELLKYPCMIVNPNLDVNDLIGLVSVNINYAVTHVKIDGNVYFMLNKNIFEAKAKIVDILNDLDIYQNATWNTDGKIAYDLRDTLYPPKHDMDYYFTRINAGNKLFKFISSNKKHFIENSSNSSITKEVIQNLLKLSISTITKSEKLKKLGALTDLWNKLSIEGQPHMKLDIKLVNE